jgi:hypothetical protein
VFFVNERFRPSGGDFQGIGVYRSDVIWEERESEFGSALSYIVSMSPPGYPSAWLHPCRAGFRFTQHSHCRFFPCVAAWPFWRAWRRLDATLPVVSMMDHAEGK